MTNLELSEFLVESKTLHSYASLDQIHKEIMQDGGTELLFTNKNKTYRDRYYGGEPFIGEEVVFVDNKAVWSMNFYGKVMDTSYDTGEIYAFLRKALKLITVAMPFRGPEHFEEEGFTYQFSVEGTVDCYVGREAIYSGDKLIYQAYVHGGYVNR